MGGKMFGSKRRDERKRSALVDAQRSQGQQLYGHVRDHVLAISGAAAGTPALSSLSDFWIMMNASSSVDDWPVDPMFMGFQVRLSPEQRAGVQTAHETITSRFYEIRRAAGDAILMSDPYTVQQQAVARLAESFAKSFALAPEQAPRGVADWIVARGLSSAIFSVENPQVFGGPDTFGMTVWLAAAWTASDQRQALALA